MTDTFSPIQRSAVMRAVKSENTAPELKVRKAAHALGLRFRLHRSDLPGKPDLVFSRKKTALFVHGCFWHGHDCPRGARRPKTNSAYWEAKISRNARRDAAHICQLAHLGWTSLVIWECETLDPARLRKKIAGKLGSVHET